MEAFNLVTVIAIILVARLAMRLFFNPFIDFENRDDIEDKKPSA